MFFSEEFDSASTDTVGAETSTLAGFEPSIDTGKVTLKSDGGDRVEGERLPDFGTFGKKTAEPTKEPEGEKTAPKPEKPASEAAAPKKEAAKPEAKPAKTDTKPESVKPESKPAAKSEIPADDSDLDALAPKPGSPSHVVKSFSEMRARMRSERAATRETMAAMTALKAEFETLKTSSGKVSPEIEAELDGLRKLSLLINAEEDPRFKAEFGAKVEGAEAKIFGFMAKHKLSHEVVDEIKAAAAQAKGDIEAWPRWGELVDAFKNPIDRQELIDAIKGRRDVIGAKATRLNELSESREKYSEHMGMREQTDRSTFAAGVEKRSIDLAAANDWILEEEVPSSATEEQAKLIAERNATVAKRSTEFSDYIRAAYSRDPDKTAEMAMKAVEAGYLREQMKSITTERDKSKARVKALEDSLAKIKSAGRMAHVESPAADTKAKASESAGVGGDGSSALKDFWASKK